MTKTRGPGFTVFNWEGLNPVDFPQIQAGVIAGVNTALHAPENTDTLQILKNRDIISQYLNIDPASWITARQVHGTGIEICTQGDAGKGALHLQEALVDTDAFILKDSPLQGLLFTADCLPVILIDKKQNRGALIHAGWRGASERIVPQCLSKMQEHCGSHIDDIYAFCGPAIDACCYQVDRPVYDAFYHTSPESMAAFTEDGDDHWRLSLEKAVFLQLKKAGLSGRQMAGSGMCTACHEEELFSWRREGKGCGRLASYLCLKST